MIKEVIIEILEKEGYLPDEAKRKVEDSWWIVEMIFEMSSELRNNDKI